MRNMNIKELNKQMLEIEAEQFEEFINEMYRLKYPENHVYDSSQKSDGGADGYSKTKEYVLACYAPKKDKTLDLNKINIDILKHIKLIQEEKFEISHMYIKSTDIGFNRKDFPFQQSYFKIVEKKNKRVIQINCNEFIDNNLNIFNLQTIPAYLKKYYTKNGILKKEGETYKRIRNVKDIYFDYSFLEKFRNEWMCLMNDTQVDYNSKFDIFNEYLNLENILQINTNNEIQNISEGLKIHFSSQLMRDEEECTYTLFLKKHYSDDTERLIKIHDYLHLEKLQDRLGSIYLGYETEIKEALSDLKVKRNYFRKNSDALETFQIVYSSENILRIDNRINEKIHKGLCGHIGSDLSEIYKENDGINWDK